MEDENTLIITMDDGREVEMEILFTFDSEDGGKHYVLFFNPEDESGEVFASYYDENGTLTTIESDSEWQMIEEVFNSFVEEENENEAFEDGKNN